MTIEEALTAYVKSAAGITALITSGSETRFYFDDAQAGKALPYIICQCVDNIPIHTHQGQAKTEGPNYQLTAYASTRAGARILAEAIKTAFCDYSGIMSGLTIQYITLKNEMPGTTTSSDGTIKLHVVDLEFEIIYNKE